MERPTNGNSRTLLICRINSCEFRQKQILTRNVVQLHSQRVGLFFGPLWPHWPSQKRAGTGEPALELFGILQILSGVKSDQVCIQVCAPALQLLNISCTSPRLHNSIAEGIEKLITQCPVFVMDGPPGNHIWPHLHCANNTHEASKLPQNLNLNLHAVRPAGRQCSCNHNMQAGETCSLRPWQFKHGCIQL